MTFLPYNIMVARAVYREFFYICFPAFLNLLVNLEGLGVFPLDAARNSTRFGATNASRALTAVQFRLATVSLQLVQIKYLLPSTKY